MEKGHNLFLVKTYFFTTKTVPAQKFFMHIYKIKPCGFHWKLGKTGSQF